MNPQEILDELLNTEFKDVKQKYKKITIVWEIPNEQASTWVLDSLDEEFYEPVVYLNKQLKHQLLTEQEILKEFLRHECLHLSLGKKTGLKEFNEHARKRKILPER